MGRAALRVSVADLDTAIGDRQRVLLDSSVLIAFHNPHEQTHPLAAHALQRIRATTDELRGYVSMVSACEVMVRPVRTSTQAFTFMHEFLTGFPNLTLLPVDLGVASQAATLRSVSRARLGDALIVASGLLAGCEVLLSNDARWKQRLEPLFPQFRWLYLGDYL